MLLYGFRTTRATALIGRLSTLLFIYMRYTTFLTSLLLSISAWANAPGNVCVPQGPAMPIKGWWERVFEDPIATLTLGLLIATLLLWWVTRKMVVGADETAKRQLRAYVGVESVKIQNEKRTNGGVDQYVYVEARNFGQTPASHCSYWLDISSQRLPLLTELTKSDSVQDSSIGVVAPTGKFRARTELPLLENDGEINAGRSAMYLHGQFHYADVFGRRHTTNFRFMRRGEGWTCDGEMEVCAEGNDAT